MKSCHGLAAKHEGSGDQRLSAQGILFLVKDGDSWGSPEGTDTGDSLPDWSGYNGEGPFFAQDGPW